VSAGPESRAWFERALRVLPGGVDSPVRAFGAVGGEPLVIQSAHGVTITDVDGREWDITQAVYRYGFDAGGFTGGSGAFARVPVLNPSHLSSGDSGYPAASDTFELVGTVVDGAARAYALDTLAAIEVIDDVHGQTLSAVVYDPMSATASAVVRSVDGDALTLAASGWHYGGRSVLFDYETESLWYRLGDGAGLTCINGDLLNTFLDPIASVQTRWNDWRMMHPMTQVFGAP